MNRKQKKHLIKTIEKLQSYKGNSSTILSVYLNNANDAIGAKLSEDFQKLLAASKAESLPEIQAAIETIRSFLLTDYDTRNHLQGIVFFAGKNIWEIANFDFSINNQCAMLHVPYMTPLLQSLSQEARYLFVVADREKADIFTLYQGGLEDIKVVFDPTVPQKVKSNKEDFYARNNKILRHIQDHLHRHLQKISQETDYFIKGRPVDGVFVGGHKPLLHEIERHLRPNLQKKLRGEFVTELNISQPIIIKHAQSQLQKYLQGGEYA